MGSVSRRVFPGSLARPLHVVLASATLCAPLVMLMKDVVHNLPRPIDFEEREQVSVAVAVPVIEFQPDPSNRVDDVDTDDPGVEPCGRGIVVHSVKEELDSAAKELPSA